MEDLTSQLGPKTYETKTMGTRHTEAARAVGEGASFHEPAAVSHPAKSKLFPKKDEACMHACRRKSVRCCSRTG